MLANLEKMMEGDFFVGKEVIIITFQPTPCSRELAVNILCAQGDVCWRGNVSHLGIFRSIRGVESAQEVWEVDETQGNVREHSSDCSLDQGSTPDRQLTQTDMYSNSYNVHVIQDKTSMIINFSQEYITTCILHVVQKYIIFDRKKKLQITKDELGL